MSVCISGGKVFRAFFPEQKLLRESAHGPGTGLAAIAVDQQGIRVPVFPQDIQALLRLLPGEQHGLRDLPLHVVKQQGQHAPEDLLSQKRIPKPSVWVSWMEMTV